MVGDTLTIADIAIYAEYQDVFYLGDMQTTTLHNLNYWAKNCEETPGIKAVHCEGSHYAESVLPEV